MHHIPTLIVGQRENLTTLAEHLKTLPVDYPDFDMESFVSGPTCDASGFAHTPACGTAACAAGHGPDAGIDPIEGETWMGYSMRAFAPDEGADLPMTPWDWCFSANWSVIDNSAHGAADRILYMLDKGIPDNAFEQLMGDDPVSYRAISA